MEKVIYSGFMWSYGLLENLEALMRNLEGLKSAYKSVGHYFEAGICQVQFFIPARFPANMCQSPTEMSGQMIKVVPYFLKLCTFCCSSQCENLKEISVTQILREIKHWQKNFQSWSLCSYSNLIMMIVTAYFSFDVYFKHFLSEPEV